jgi:hypothetical protein
MSVSNANMAQCYKEDKKCLRCLSKQGLTRTNKPFFKHGLSIKKVQLTWIKEEYVKKAKKDIMKFSK